MTLEQIVNAARTFAENHDQVKSFFEGQLEDNTVKKDALYYRLMMELQPSVIDEGNETFVFRVGVFGKVHSDQSNRINVLSDTRQICTDFIAYFRNNPDMRMLRINVPVTITDYVDYSDDAVAGYFMDVTLYQYQQLNYCVVPVSDPDNAYLTENGIEYITESGQTLILE